MIQKRARKNHPHHAGDRDAFKSVVKVQHFWELCKFLREKNGKKKQKTVATNVTTEIGGLV